MRKTFFWQVDKSTCENSEGQNSDSDNECVCHLCCCRPAGAPQWSPVLAPVCPAPGGSRPAGAGWPTRPRVKLCSPRCRQSEPHLQRAAGVSARRPSRRLLSGLHGGRRPSAKTTRHLGQRVEVTLCRSTRRSGGASSSCVTLYNYYYYLLLFPSVINVQVTTCPPEGSAVAGLCIEQSWEATKDKFNVTVVH